MFVFSMRLPVMSVLSTVNVLGLPDKSILSLLKTSLVVKDGMIAKVAFTAAVSMLVSLDISFLL
jgi:hypothetical protein